MKTEKFFKILYQSQIKRNQNTQEMFKFLDYDNDSLLNSSDLFNRLPSLGIIIHILDIHDIIGELNKDKKK